LPTEDPHNPIFWRKFLERIRIKLQKEKEIQIQAVRYEKIFLVLLKFFFREEYLSWKMKDEVMERKITELEEELKIKEKEEKEFLEK
jgi:hypothetical protein